MMHTSPISPFQACHITYSHTYTYLQGWSSLLDIELSICVHIGSLVEYYMTIHVHVYSFYDALQFLLFHCWISPRQLNSSCILLAFCITSIKLWYQYGFCQSYTNYKKNFTSFSFLVLPLLLFTFYACVNPCSCVSPQGIVIQKMLVLQLFCTPLVP